MCDSCWVGKYCGSAVCVTLIEEYVRGATAPRGVSYEPLDFCGRPPGTPGRAPRGRSNSTTTPSSKHHSLQRWQRSTQMGTHRRPPPPPPPYPRQNSLQNLAKFSDSQRTITERPSEPRNIVPVISEWLEFSSRDDEAVKLYVKKGLIPSWENFLTSQKSSEQTNNSLKVKNTSHNTQNTSHTSHNGQKEPILPLHPSMSLSCVRSNVQDSELVNRSRKTSSYLNSDTVVIDMEAKNNAPLPLGFSIEDLLNSSPKSTVEPRSEIHHSNSSGNSLRVKDLSSLFIDSVRRLENQEDPKITRCYNCSKELTLPANSIIPQNCISCTKIMLPNQNPKCVGNIKKSNIPNSYSIEVDGSQRVAIDVSCPPPTPAEVLHSTNDSLSRYYNKKFVVQVHPSISEISISKCVSSHVDKFAGVSSFNSTSKDPNKTKVPNIKSSATEISKSDYCHAKVPDIGTRKCASENSSFISSQKVHSFRIVGCAKNEGIEKFGSDITRSINSRKDISNKTLVNSPELKKNRSLTENLKHDKCTVLGNTEKKTVPEGIKGTSSCDYSKVSNKEKKSCGFPSVVLENPKENSKGLGSVTVQNKNIPSLEILQEELNILKKNLEEISLPKEGDAKSEINNIRDRVQEKKARFDKNALQHGIKKCFVVLERLENIEKYIQTSESKPCQKVESNNNKQKQSRLVQKKKSENKENKLNERLSQAKQGSDKKKVHKKPRNNGEERKSEALKAKSMPVLLVSPEKDKEKSSVKNSNVLLGVGFAPSKTGKSFISGSKKNCINKINYGNKKPKNKMDLLKQINMRSKPKKLLNCSPSFMQFSKTVAMSDKCVKVSRFYHDLPKVRKTKLPAQSKKPFIPSPDLLENGCKSTVKQYLSGGIIPLGSSSEDRKIISQNQNFLPTTLHSKAVKNDKEKLQKFPEDLTGSFFFTQNVYKLSSHQSKKEETAVMSNIGQLKTSSSDGDNRSEKKEDCLGEIDPGTVSKTLSELNDIHILHGGKDKEINMETEETNQIGKNSSHIPTVVCDHEFENSKINITNIPTNIGTYDFGKSTTLKSGVRDTNSKMSTNGLPVRYTAIPKDVSHGSIKTPVIPGKFPFVNTTFSRSASGEETSPAITTISQNVCVNSPVRPSDVSIDLNKTNDSKISKELNPIVNENPGTHRGGIFQYLPNMPIENHRKRKRIENHLLNNRKNPLVCKDKDNAIVINGKELEKNSNDKELEKKASNILPNKKLKVSVVIENKDDEEFRNADTSQGSESISSEVCCEINLSRMAIELKNVEYTEFICSFCRENFPSRKEWVSHSSKCTYSTRSTLQA